VSIRSIHEKLGTAGFIISIIALVAALGGSAFAAKGALTHKQKKEVRKIAKKEAKREAQTEAKKYAGKPGPAGAKGDTGAKGDRGAKGAVGRRKAGRCFPCVGGSVVEVAVGGTAKVRSS
jgi:hypothetical protein